MSRIRVSAAALLMMVSGSTFAAGPIPLPVPTLPGLDLGQVLGGLDAGAMGGMPALPDLTNLLRLMPQTLDQLPGFGGLPGQGGLGAPGLLGLTPAVTLPGLGLLSVVAPPPRSDFSGLGGRPGGN